VADAPLTLTTASLNLVEGHYDNLVVASFTDADPAATAADFQAVIHWGDGFVSTASAAQGTIVPNGQGGFNVLGSHTYDNGSLVTPDGAQPLAPFSVQVYDLGPSDTPATAVHQDTGGPGNGPYQQGTHTLTTVVQVAHLSQRVAQGGVWDPAVQGPITSLNYSYDFCVFSGPSTTSQVAVGFLVKQGDNYYVAGYGGVGQNGWITGTTQTASSFTLVAGNGPSTPDFSAWGLPLEFGYFTANSGSGVLETLVWGIANFKVTINGTTYQDTNFNDSDWINLTLRADNLGAAMASQTGSLTVTAAPLSLKLAPLTFTEGQPNSNVVVASFTDADLAVPAANFQATIQWGDGFVSTASAAQGTIVPNGQGGFNVLGSHTYAEEAQNLPFSVQVQDLGRWDTPSREGNMATGGPTGGPYEQGRDIFTTQIYTAHISARVAQNGVYYPAVSGPVTSLTYSFDFCLFSGPSTVDQYAVGLMVKQGENYYVSDYTDIAQDGWNIGQTLTASHFYLISGSGPAAPDFSATGAPLQFGFLTAHTCLGLQTFVWGIANFKVTINGTTYQDTNFNDSDWTHVALVSDDLGEAQSSKSTALTVADAPLALLNLVEGSNSNLVEGSNSNVVVASFTDGDAAGRVSDYQATIQWGDGSSSAGSIVANSAGGFNVLDSHTYAEEGQNMRVKATPGLIYVCKQTA